MGKIEYNLVGSASDATWMTEPHVKLNEFEVILEKAGVKLLPFQVLDAFDRPYFPEDFERIKEYREKTGRMSPPAYKIKMTIEVEELSPEASAEFWDALAKPKSKGPA